MLFSHEHQRKKYKASLSYLLHMIVRQKCVYAFFIEASKNSNVDRVVSYIERIHQICNQLKGVAY